MNYLWIYFIQIRIFVFWPSVFIIFLCFWGSVYGQAPATVDEVVDFQLKIRQQKARIDVARWELSAGTMKPPADGTPGLRNLVGKALNAALETKPALPANFDRVDQKLLEYWRKAEKRSMEFRLIVLKLETQYGFSFANGTQAPHTLGLLDLSIVVWFFLAFAIACLLGWHDLRVNFRRWARAEMPGGSLMRKPVVAVSTPLILGCLLLNGCQGPVQKDERPTIGTLRKAAEDELKLTTAEAIKLQAEVDERHDQTITDWGNFSGEVADRSAALKARDREILNMLRAQAIHDAFESLLSDDIASHVKSEPLDDEKLKALTLTARNRSYAIGALRLSSALALSTVAFLPFWLVRRIVRRQRNREARTCPQCLAVGSLVLKNTPRNQGGYTESSYLECSSTDENGNSCGYRLARSHQRVTRLCFPTVGIRSSGKTHMLTTAYSAICNRTAPSLASFQPAPSVMDERFRQYIELILRQRSEAGGTVHDTEYLPPLLVHARDVDFWGPNSVMINLFDYSGELVEETPLAQMLRPRAMNMDGFMVFFDPTQIYGAENGKANATLEDQVRALANFYQQMADIRGLEPGSRISNPVAICISKFDLLESENPIGGECLPEILKLDGPLKPTGDAPVTMSMLKARSELVETMLPRMFPGVNIRRLVEEYFGNQMLFFPMSSVNLNIDEFGRVDPTSRNPVPYGVVEPILWLMHMHGYCVLDA